MAARRRPARRRLRGRCLARVLDRAGDHERVGVDERQLHQRRHDVHRAGGRRVGNSASTGTSTSAGTLDVGTVMDFGPVQPPGCKGKVDLLFVISRQGTMKTEQTQLLASFAGFIDTIEQKLEGFDVHIMTANPDGDWPGDVCQYQGGCKMNWPACGDWAEGYDCATYPDMVTPCDKHLGAGLIFNVGADAANRLCDLQDGKRYIMSGEPDMAGALECIAKVGWSGGDPLRRPRWPARRCDVVLEAGPARAALCRKVPGAAPSFLLRFLMIFL